MEAEESDDISENPSASIRRSYNAFIHKIRQKTFPRSVSAQRSIVTNISDLSAATELTTAGFSAYDAPISEVIPPSIVTGTTSVGLHNLEEADESTTASIERLGKNKRNRKLPSFGTISNFVATADEDPEVLERKLRQKGLGSLRERNMFIYKVYSILTMMQLLAVLWMNFFISNAATVKRDEIVSIFFLTLIYALILQLTYYFFNRTIFDNFFKWIYLFGCVLIGTYLIPFLCLYYVLPGKHNHDNQEYYEAELWIIVVIKCEFFAFLSSVVVCILGLQNTFELAERRVFFIISGVILGIPVLLEIIYVTISAVMWKSLDRSLIAFEKIFPRWFIGTWITYGIIVFAFYDVRRMVLGNRHRRLTSEDSIAAVILLYMDVINMPFAWIPPLNVGRVRIPKTV